MRYHIYSFLLFISGFWFRIGYSQEVKSYARKVIDTLCSPHMHGRGYVNDGDKIAARYIRDEFKKLGLVSLTKDYYQHFTLPVNTFPGKIETHISYIDKATGPGLDYNIGSASAAIKADNYKLLWFDSSIVNQNIKITSFLRNNFKNAFVIVDERGISKENMKVIEWAKSNPFKAKGIVVYNYNKLTWDVSSKKEKYVVVEQLIPDEWHNEHYHKNAEHIFIEIETKFIPSYPTQNIIGKIEGLQQPDSFMVFTAHYDHLGRMGKDVYFPGANDNASGVAMLLNLAKHYSKPENKPKYSMLFIAFGAEEAGLVGSKYFVEHPLVPLEKIKFLINMDLMGTGDEGMMVVNGAVHKEEYDKLVKINDEKKYLPQIKARGKAANSDHYFFSEVGVKSFFFYTLGGIKAYHDVFDRPETLPLTKFEEIFNLINDFTKKL